MKFSTKTRYSLRALADLAFYSKNSQPVLLKEIAQREDLPHKYLESLFLMLRQKGIIKSIRGAKGGYVLSRSLDEITMLEVVESLEGPIQVVNCKDKQEICSRINFCPTTSIYQEINLKLKNILKSYTLRMLLDNYVSKKENVLSYTI